jgi:hypothetical protein
VVYLKKVLLAASNTATFAKATFSVPFFVVTTPVSLVSCAKSKLMLNNNKNAMVVFMLFGFVISKCIGDCRDQKSFYTIWVFYYMKPEKRAIPAF